MRVGGEGRKGRKKESRASMRVPKRARAGELVRNNQRTIPRRRVCVTYVTQYARCRSVPGHLSARLALANSRASERMSARAHSTRGRFAIKRNGRAAPALITARRRRSYFTPGSSIIHAVNNAPLFRVTLYRVLLPSPSFFPALRPVRPPGGR